MNQRRFEGLNRLFLIDEQSNYSALTLGLLIRATTHELKIAIIGSPKKHSKIFNFLENLCISANFKKEFEKIHIETFLYNNKNNIQRGILPDVEFGTIDEAYLFKHIYKFDLIIFDQIPKELQENILFDSLLKGKQDETEIITILNKNEIFTNKKKFNSIYQIKSQKSNSLISNSNITILEGPLSDIISYGELISAFIQKANVKIITFDKNDQYYGEFTFFQALKNWKKLNLQYYGEFDFVTTGIPRLHGPQYRTKSNINDIKEAKEALMLLKTALVKQTPIIADNLNSAFENNLINSKEIENLLSKVENQLIINENKKINPQIEKFASNKITIEIIKESNLENKRKKGIEF